jgi:predicted secreted protein
MSTREASSGGRWRVVLVAAALMAAVAACGDDDGTQVLTDADIGSEIDVDGGERFEIRLESNPSTGYAWELSEMTTPDLVVLESRTHVPADSDLVGASGTDVFVFTAVRGAGVLRLEYVRSFDDPVVAERVAEFVVRVDDAEWPPAGGSLPATTTTSAP